MHVRLETWEGSRLTRHVSPQDVVREDTDTPEATKLKADSLTSQLQSLAQEGACYEPFPDAVAELQRIALARIETDQAYERRVQCLKNDIRTAARNKADELAAEHSVKPPEASSGRCHVLVCLALHFVLLCNQAIYPASNSMLNLLC